MILGKAQIMCTFCFKVAGPCCNAGLFTPNLAGMQQHVLDQMAFFFFVVGEMPAVWCVPLLFTQDGVYFSQ